MSFPDWGNVPGWGTLFGAAYAARVAFRSIRLDKADRKRAQASQCAIWLGAKDPKAVLRPTHQPLEIEGVWFRNASQVPVYEALGRVHYVEYAGSAEYVDIPIGTFPPSSDPIYYSLDYFTGTGALENIHHVTMEFRDTNSVWWVRDEHGDLKEGRLGGAAVPVPEGFKITAMDDPERRVPPHAW